MPIIRSWYDEMLGRQKQWFSHNECFDMSNTLAQLVERHCKTVKVAGSIPVCVIDFILKSICLDTGSTPVYST